MYVSDTHALIYYAASKHAKLGRDSRRLFKAAETGTVLIYIPAVVLWEVWQTVSEGAVVLPSRFDHWCRALESNPGFAIEPLTWQAVDHSRQFRFKDPFDCLIAGTASHLGMPLITKDAKV